MTASSFVLDATSYVPKQINEVFPPVCDASSHLGSNIEMFRAANRDILVQTLQHAQVMLAEVYTSLKSWHGIDREIFGRWFGSRTKVARRRVRNRILRMMKAITKVGINNFCPAEEDAEGNGLYAYVYPSHRGVMIFLGQEFFSSPLSGTDSKSGTVLHELSHLIGQTDDFVYGLQNALFLAHKNHLKALANADNFEYWAESLDAETLH